MVQKPSNETTINSVLQIFNDTLTKDDKKRVSTPTNNKHPVISSTLDELLKETEAAKDKCLGKPGPFRKKLESILTTIEQYAQVIDVLIQHHPDITALVWGSLRGLIGVWNSLADCIKYSSTLRCGASTLLSSAFSGPIFVAHGDFC